MSSPQAQKAPEGAAEFDRHTELLLACTPYLHVTAVAKLCVSSKELRGACQAAAQQQFPRLMKQLLWEFAKHRRNARRAAALSWLCGMAGRAAVAAASQQCLELGCGYWNGLREEDVQLLVAHGVRLTCQMVVDSARRGVDGAAVWLRAGAVDDAPDLLLWTSMGDEAHVERLRDLLYNGDDLPPQQQLLDALQLAANMMCNDWSSPQPSQGLGLLQALLFPPSSLSSGASPHVRQQQLLALVPAADLERLLSALMTSSDDEGIEMATAVCSIIPAAGELPGAAVLGLIKGSITMNYNKGSHLVSKAVSTLGRLPGAAEMPLDEVAGLLPAVSDEWFAGEDVLEALLEMPRVQQAITADVADKMLRCAVKCALLHKYDGMIVEPISDSVAAGLVTTQGLAAAMEQYWKCACASGESIQQHVWRQLWSFPAAEEMSPEQLHSVLLTAVTHECCKEDTLEQLLEDNPFVQQRVDWFGLLQAVAHELRTSSDKRSLCGQLVLLVSLQAQERTISEPQVTELLQAAIETQCGAVWRLSEGRLCDELSSPSVLLLLKHAVLHGADGSVVQQLCGCPAAPVVPVSELCEVARSAVERQAGKEARQALRLLLLKVPGVPADVLMSLFDGVA